MTARKKPSRPVQGNVAGLKATLAALEAAGRLDDEAAALVALASGLAAAVDAEPGNAALWREYRATLAALTEVGTDGDDDDTASFILKVRTPLGNAAKP